MTIKTQVRTIRLLGVVAFSMFIAACVDGSPTGTRTQTVSCYDTATGVMCNETPNGPQTEPTDIDGDGQPDPFVCADSDEVDDESGEDTGAEDEAGIPDNNDSDGDGIDDAQDDDDDNDGINDTEDPDDDNDGIDDTIDCDSM